MATSTSPQPSFSPRRKWAIALNVVAATMAVFAILVGLNYLSQFLFKRVYLSSGTRVELSPRTVGILKELTNRVEVIVYYNKEEALYSDIMSLLKEYQAHTRKLSVRTVDYYDPGAAQELRAKYDFAWATNKDFIIFNCEGRSQFVDGTWLSSTRDELVQSESETNTAISINRKRIAFNGEMLFTAKIFAVTQPKPLKAYFLQSHLEHSPTNNDDTLGYFKFADVLRRNYIEIATLGDLSGSNGIPSDCNLLLIMGPRAEFAPVEREKIAQYLDQGGRLFASFNVSSMQHTLGLEEVLEKWNVRVAHNTILDPSCALDKEQKGTAFSITNFVAQDVTKPLINSQAQMAIVLPRAISAAKTSARATADEPIVTELAFSSPHSIASGINAPGEPRAYPLMVAVEKAAPKGVITARGSTRMLILGDSFFLDNQFINVGMNQDFADSAVNWLLERSTFRVGPRPIAEYRLLLNPTEMNAIQGILLGAIPGGILLFGGLVWLRRRK